MTTATDTPCAARSAEAGEPLAGTAPRASAWILWETRQPWAASAPSADGCDPAVWARLRALKAAHGDAKLLWVRPGERGDEARALTLQLVQAHTERVTALPVPDPLSLLDLPADHTISGAPQASEGPSPLFVVCTHGKRDACCARLGLPVLRALCNASAPGSVWQSTHLGGHRFAPTLLVLPWGYCYGRLTPQEAADLPAAFAHRRLIHLHRLRGRATFDPPTQAAEVSLRQHLDLTGLDDLTHLRTDALGAGRWRVTFLTAQTTHSLFVEETTRADALTAPSCGDPLQPFTTLSARLLDGSYEAPP
jgi:hypothetical protein